MKVKNGSVEKKPFARSRAEELKGLLHDGTFHQVHVSKIKDGVRIFGSRFVDELKSVGEELKQKAASLPKITRTTAQGKSPQKRQQFNASPSG